LKNISVTNNLPPSPFTKGGIITPPFSKGRLGGIFLLTNPKGISVLFLVIAMMLMVTIGYVFSYLIPTKQKSISFTIHSTKAFFLAQSGVEFAVRYAVTGGWTTPANLVANINNVVRTLGDRNGQFTVNYDRPTNTLTSTGVIPNVSERKIVVSNFTSFLINPTGLILDPRSPSPCGANGTTTARFYIRNASESSVTLTYFSATWTGGRNLTGISMNGVPKFSGSRASNSTRRTLNLGSQTIAPDGIVMVDLTWNNTLTGTNIILTFYTGAAGNGYIFYLDPAGGGLRGCP
jgi:hypothetical protein